MFSFARPNFQAGESTPADHLALSADGHTAAASYLTSVQQGTREHAQTTIVFYEMTQGGPIQKVVPWGESVVRLELSSDGKYAVVITRKFPKRTETAQLFETHTGAELKKWEDYNVAGKWCAFTNDAKSLIVAGSDTRVVEWSLPGVHERHSFPGFYASVNAVAVSRDDRLVFAGGDDAKARIWDRSTAKNLTILTGHIDPVLSVAFSSDATLAITGGADGHAKIWAWRDSPGMAKFDVAADSPVYSVALSSDNRYAAVGGSRSIQLISVLDGTQIWLKHTSDQVNEATFSEDVTYLAIHTGFAFIHKIPSGLRLSPPGSHFFATQFSADGKQVLYSFEGGEVLRDLASNKRLLTLGPDNRAH